METRKAVAALGALAQETRLSIFRLLVQAGPAGVPAGEIGARVKAAPATTSFHLKELNHVGLIEARQEGRFVFYSACYSRMNELLEFLSENCCAGDPTARSLPTKKSGSAGKRRVVPTGRKRTC